MLLTKIKSIHENVRSKTMEGECLHLPKAGFSFRIIAIGGGLEFGDRIIVTTPVNKIKEIDEYTVQFMTNNSTYQLFQYAEDRSL